MKQSDTKRILELLTQLTEAVGGPPPGLLPGVPKASLSDRLGKLDDRVSEVQHGLATLAVNTTAQFQKIDERFGKIDERFGKIDERFAKIDERFAKIDERFAKIDERFGKIDERFGKIDERFDSVDVQFTGVRGAIETTRAQLVDLVSSVHSELTGRIIDLEVPGPGGRGGSPSGSGGVPLAS